MSETQLKHWITKLSTLQTCNMYPDKCTHDRDEQGHIQPFDYASIDMTLDQVISEMKQELEESKNEIAIIWSLEDVKEIAPDLTDDECRAVLALSKSEHDATIGVNWDTLEVWADHVREARNDRQTI